MEKYLPIVLAVINSILSTIGNKTTLPVETISGFEGISLIIALFASLSGTILGMLKMRRSRQALFLILTGILLIPALLQYNAILALGGATRIEQHFALFLYFYIFMVVLFAITLFERWLAELFKKDKGKESPKAPKVKLSPARAGADEDPLGGGADPSRHP